MLDRESRPQAPTSRPRALRLTGRTLWSARLGLLLVVLSVSLGVAGAALASSGANRHDGRTQPTATQMPGMDHGTGKHDEMPGMEHGSSGTEMPGMDHHTVPMSVPEPQRPLALVLGGFGTASGAVLVAAAILRRRDESASRERRARLNPAGDPA